jgi:hypothetical protein
MLILINPNMTSQLLEERLIDFAVTIVGVVEALPSSKSWQPDAPTIKNQHSSIINHQSNRVACGFRRPISARPALVVLWMQDRTLRTGLMRILC